MDFGGLRVLSLESRRAEMMEQLIRRWTLPDDRRPLREAVRRIAERECDVVVFTTSIQLVHLLEAAEEEAGRAAEVLQALREDLAVASVGPVMNTALADYGIEPDIVPAHPKMGILVRAASESAATMLARKRHIIAR
jgi:uroporphyrinogen-III synthase